MSFNEGSHLFLEEAEDLLADAEASLLDLEKNPKDTTLINQVFRDLHTIKGSGSMFGFTAVAEFTHDVESLFDEIRKGTLSVDRSIIEIGLQAIDGIRQILQDHNALSLLLDLRNKIVTKIPTKSTSTSERKKSAGPHVWRIILNPSREIMTRGVQFDPLFRELSEWGSCQIRALTDDIPAFEEMDPISLYLSWVIVISTERSLEELRSVFLFVEDYADLQFEVIDVASEQETLQPKIGEILVKRGSLDIQQVEAIRKNQRAFGEMAVEQGYVKRDEVEVALAEQEVVRGAAIERYHRQESVTIRVHKEKLDKLIDLVGELVTLQAIFELDAKRQNNGVFSHLSEQLALLVGDLRDTTMSVRMVALDDSFSTFQRLIRDLSKQVGKELLLETEGGKTELDKNVVDALKDPLVHLIRNAADHGIEDRATREQLGKPSVGTIRIGARQRGSQVEITISDDGAGLDLEKIKSRAVERKLLDASENDINRIQSMIFEPGFSTTENINDLSGRGVGMDVVKKSIEKLRGSVSISSVRHQGTTISLLIPLTLVIVDGLLITIAGLDYIITLNQVLECVDISPSVVIRHENNKASLINLRGKTIPIISLRQVLGFSDTYEKDPRLVIVNNEGGEVALMVDGVVGRKQVVIKPLSSAIRGARILSGASILGDGSVALILDVASIIRLKA